MGIEESCSCSIVKRNLTEISIFKPFLCNSRSIPDNRKLKIYSGTSFRRLTFLRPKILETRMHSSRMRTTHLLTISQHALPGGFPGGGCVCSGGVVCLGGVADPPLCAQNDRLVLKHYLTATSLQAITRMHSSRMRTVCCSGCLGGGCPP